MRTAAATPLLLSPELALVDPELAAAARARLPLGGEGEVWRLRFPTVAAPLAPVLVLPRRRRLAEALAFARAGALCATAGVFAYAPSIGGDRPYLVGDEDGVGGVASASMAMESLPAPTMRPQSGLPVRVSPAARKTRTALRGVIRLGWWERPEATYYRVRIQRARARRGAPVLELRTAAAEVALSAGVKTDLRRRVLAPGAYRWSVRPVGERRATAQGTFTIGY